MNQWEYMTEDVDPFRPLPRLNELGAKGWELAGTTAGREGFGEGTRETLTAFLKRPVELTRVPD